MPHHGFFAVRSDVRLLFEFVFSKTDCEVFESMSIPDRALRRFVSAEEVAQAAEAEPYHLGLMLYAPAMGGQYAIRRFQLTPGAIAGKSWREEVQGWGLVQVELDFTTAKNGFLRESFESQQPAAGCDLVCHVHRHASGRSMGFSQSRAFPERSIVTFATTFR